MRIMENKDSNEICLVLREFPSPENKKLKDGVGFTISGAGCRVVNNKIYMEQWIELNKTRVASKKKPSGKKKNIVTG